MKMSRNRFERSSPEVPDVPGKAEEAADPEKPINTARLNAIREVVQESGTPGLIELAEKVKLPQHVAYGKPTSRAKCTEGSSQQMRDKKTCAIHHFTLDK